MQCTPFAVPRTLLLSLNPRNGSVKSRVLRAQLIRVRTTRPLALLFFLV